MLNINLSRALRGCVLPLVEGFKGIVFDLVYPHSLCSFDDPHFMNINFVVHVSKKNRIK